MLEILQMWIMARYFNKRKVGLSALHKVGDPVMDEIRKKHGIDLAAVLEAQIEDEKTRVAKNVLKAAYVLDWSPRYIFRKNKHPIANNIRTVEYAKRIKKSNTILLNCLNKGFLKTSEKYSSYVSLTLEGEQFSTCLGLFREWLIYLAPATTFLLGGGAVAILWLVNYIWHKIPL